MRSLFNVERGGNWDAFWQPGVRKTDLLKRLKAAKKCRLAGNTEGTLAALEAFADDHQDFPVSNTDGAPLAYGINIFGSLKAPLETELAALREAAGATAVDPRRYVLLSRLERLCGNFDAASAAAHAAAAADPDNAFAHFQLGSLYRIRSAAEEADTHYSRASALAPNNAAMHLLRGELLQGIDKHEDAIAAFRRVIELTPKDPRAYNDLSCSLQWFRRFDEAMAASREAVRLEPNRHTFYHMAFCQLSSGDNAGAAETCIAALRHNPLDSMALALLPSALDAVGHGNQARALTDFSGLIKYFDIAPPARYGDLKTFNAALTEIAVAAEPRIFDPTQTNDLFLSNEGPFADFGAIVDKAIADYYAALPTNPGHPFLAHRMKKWRIDGWATRLWNYRENQHHFHKHAWLSGVYYARVPDIVSRSNDQSGWLEFCRLRSYSGPPKMTEVAAVPPREGRLLLFPSYFYHRVLPFGGDDLRVSIAFNITPDD